MDSNLNKNCDKKVLRRLASKEHKMCSSSDRNKSTLNNLCDQEFIFGSTPRGGLATPVYLQQMMHSDNHQCHNTATAIALNAENKVGQNIVCLEKQVEELTHKLKESERNRNELKKRLGEAIEEKERSYRRLDVISSAHESRITEMHCVIAELSKKLRAKQDATIAEENEPDGSELSFQCESTRDSEAEQSNPDNRLENEEAPPEYQSETLLVSNPTNKTQVEGLQEEVFHLKAQIAYLQSQIANENDSSPEAHQQNNKESLRDTAIDTNFDNATSDVEYDNPDGNQPETRTDQEMFVQHHVEPKFVDTGFTLLTKENINRIEKQQSGAPITKMAERVKLRRTIEDQHITGPEILNSGIHSTEIVENLVSNVNQSENVVGNSNTPMHLKSEVQRLQRHIEYMKARNTVMSLTLDECKRHCEHLYLLCGKYESNAIALQAALNCSDRAIEAYDVMLALLESKLALLKEKSLSSQESRRAVEAVARHLLDRLDSERNVNENSLGPWQNTVCISSSQIIDPWTQEDDNRLRNHVSKLKGRRSAIQNTVVTFESPFYSKPEISKTVLELNKDENPQFELEMAVVMQEVLSLREDVIETRQQAVRTEREKMLTIEKNCMLQEALGQLQTQLTDSEALLELTTKERSSYSETDHAAAIERQLVEALSRESQLKNRIQSLIGTVSALKKTRDQTDVQVQINLFELQKANMNLSQTLELCKRKYQSRIKRLEQKILEVNIAKSQRQPDSIPETTL